MTYITNADIEERLGTATFIQLTDDTGSGLPDLDKVEEARLGAIGEVDSYLGLRYAVPVDLAAHPEPAGVLRSFTLDLAEHRLHARRPPVPDDVVRRRGEALAWLRRIGLGQTTLPAATAPRGNDALGALAGVVGPERRFTRDTLEQS